MTHTSNTNMRNQSILRHTDAWRYFRHDEALRLSAMHDGKHPLDEPLQKPDTVWRFPWPDEDADAAHLNLPGMINRPFSRCFAIILPREHRRELHRAHQEIDTQPTTNNATNCPVTARPRSVNSCLDIVEVVGLKHQPTRTTAIFRCPYCGHNFQLPDAVVNAIANHVADYQQTGWVKQWFSIIAQRLAATTKPITTKREAKQTVAA